MIKKIEIRKGKHFNENGVEQVVTCTFTGGQWVAGFVAGVTPNPYIDITSDVSDETLDSLEISLKKGDNGNLIREKGGTSRLDVKGESKELIMDWLFSSACSELNFWEVKMTDMCGIVIDSFEIRPDNVEISQYDPVCAINFPLKESDKQKNFLARTSVMDNHQGWYSGGKDFHTVEVAIHNTPIQHGINIGLIMFVQGFGTVPGTGVGIGSIVSGILNLDDELDINMGFGNFLATPLISEVLDNIVAKHGWTCTSPFHSGDLEMDAIFIPNAGIYHQNRRSCISNSLTFQFNNTIIQSSDEFVQELCKVYNMNYELDGVTKTLSFSFRKDKASTPITFTYSEDDVIDHKKIFQPNKRKASSEFGYSLDPADSKSNAMQKPYNDIVSNTNNVVNPLFEGIDRLKSFFAPIGFWGDGFGEDYLHSIPERGKIICIVLWAFFSLSITIASIPAAIPVVSFGVSGGFGGGPVTTTETTSLGGRIGFYAAIAAFALAGIANAFIFASNIRDDYAYDSCHEGAVHLYGTGQKSNMSIIRLESGRNKNDAKVVTQPVGSININPKYNTAGTTWINQWTGQGYHPRPLAFNYPLYYDANYFGNLYDTYYEQTQNISYFNASNFLIQMVLVACCDYLSFFGFDNESNRKEGKVIEWVYKGITYKGEVFEVKYVNNELTITCKLFR